MLKNIILTIYIIIIGIALGTIILSANYNEYGLIQFGNTALVEVEDNLLEPKIVTGDLVLINTKNKKVKEKDIISYVTLEQGAPAIRTNKITAITTDVNNEKIYSLTREDGTIENIDDSCILGTFKVTIPLAGTILSYILTKQGFLTVTLIPAIILFIFFLITFLIGVINKKRE